DVEVIAGIPLDHEAEPSQEPAAALIGGNIIGHDPMQAQPAKDERYGGAERFGHQPLSLPAVVNAVAEIAGLEGPTDEVAVVAVAEDRAVAIAPLEDGETQRHVPLVLLAVPLD